MRNALLFLGTILCLTLMACGCDEGDGSHRRDTGYNCDGSVDRDASERYKPFDSTKPNYDPYARRDGGGQRGGETVGR